MLEDVNSYKENRIHISHTIERQLKLYAKEEEATERHQVLWHSWNQNKRWLAQMLEWTLPSFQTYSYHNASHAESVLHNIERILGEKRIRLLSASDCFMLLHTAYMHDVGMCISSSERQGMMEDEKFIDLVEHLKIDGDQDMKRAAQSVFQTHYTVFEKASSRERPQKMKKLLSEKLDAYYGLGQLMAEYQRTMHAGKVRDRMQQWTMDPGKLGNSFAASGVPLRIFMRIADCAAIHTTSGLKPVMELPKEDSGYALDMIHPRFVAVLLQLGDALDIDNDRFNPFCFQFAGSFPRTSMFHYRKHQSIRQLNITPENIQIHADCDSQEALRLVRMECESLEEILKNISYHWAEIAPPGMSGCLPALDQSKILLGGQQVPGELVKAQFIISQVRAFRLLEGANVYGGSFVFLRELIQNAIDASKMQCWEDYLYRCKLKERKLLQDHYKEAEYGLDVSEKEILSEVDVWDYPIEVNFEIVVKTLNEEEEVLLTPVEKTEEEMENIPKEYGVKISIRDHGTGISKDDLIKISNVGSSYEEKRHFIDRMPDWLKPTGQFGIGLQSVFLVADSVTARTYTRSGEKYEITFNKVSNGSGGYINVKPLPQEEYVTFGTTFEIFVGCKYKLLHAEFWKAWNTESDDADRFIDQYDEMRPLRHSKEMLNQMVLYIDNMLGENLFPIYVKIQGKEFGDKQRDFIKHRTKKIVLESQTVDSESWAEQEKKVNWLFKAIWRERQEKNKNGLQDGDNEFIFVNIKDGIGALDCRNSKLHIWNKEIGAFARFGGGRMLSEYLPGIGLEQSENYDHRKTRIYLKGILVQSHSMYQDSELLELIDIKGGKIGKAHIAINRNEFTREGIEYLEKEIYPALIASAKAALIELNERENRESENKGSFCQKIEDSIWETIEKCQEEKEKEKMSKLDLEETVLSAVGLSYFLRILGKNTVKLCEKRGKPEKCYWDCLLENIVNMRWKEKAFAIKKREDESEKERKKKSITNIFDRTGEYLNLGMMHRMQVFYYDEVRRTGFEGPQKWMDYPSLLLERRKVAIISMRYNRQSRWFHIPLIISERKEDIEKKEKALDAYEIFEKKSGSWQEECDILTELEVWADGILSRLQKVENIQALHEKYGGDADIQYTLSYMLANIPTVALYADKNGNVRVNVLSSEQPRGVFFNRNMKRAIVEKVDQLQRQFHAKRFVTNVWRSYECIALEAEPSSVCMAKGAFMAKHQNEKMLLPVLGENVSKLLKLREQDFFKEIMEQKEQCVKLEEICNEFIGLNDMFKLVIVDRKILSEAAEELFNCLSREGILKSEGKKDYVKGRNLAGNYWQQMLLFLRKEVRLFLKQKIEGKKKIEIQTYEDLIFKQPNKDSFQKMLIVRFFKDRGSCAEAQTSQEENGHTDVLGLKNESKDDEKEWKWFQSAICFIDERRQLNISELLASHPKMEQFKKSLWGRENDSNLEKVQKNLIDYVMRNSVEKLSEKQIRSCYEKLLDDLLECELETEPDHKKKYSNIEALFRQSGRKICKEQ